MDETLKHCMYKLVHSMKDYEWINQSHTSIETCEVKRVSDIPSNEWNTPPGY